jgi:hypothetical protein
MGRHSAPGDDDDAGQDAVAVAVEPSAAPRGRHARGDDTDAPANRPLPPPDAPDPEQPAGATPPKLSRGNQSTAADLALLRHHKDVRNRAVAAVLAPFVLYVVVLLVLSASGIQYVLWIWIPMVVGGAAAGLVLDSGHKRYPDTPAD